MDVYVSVLFLSSRALVKPSFGLLDRGRGKGGKLSMDKSISPQVEQKKR